MNEISKCVTSSLKLNKEKWSFLFATKEKGKSHSGDSSYESARRLIFSVKDDHKTNLQSPQIRHVSPGKRWLMMIPDFTAVFLLG